MSGPGGDQIGAGNDQIGAGTPHGGGVIHQIVPGIHQIGPHNAWLRLRTYRQGVAGRLGHDLVIEATSWHGTVGVGRVAVESGRADPARADSVDVEVDLRSLRVVEGTGGVKPLTEGDKDDIWRAMQKVLRTDDFPTATFRSSEVRVDGDHATLVGELTLGNRTGPLELRAERGDDGTVRARAVVVQRAWGIAPYSGFFGALKLRDEVDVDVGVSLGGRPGSG